MLLSLLKCFDSGGILSAVSFDQSQQQPRSTIIFLFSHPIPVLFEPLIQRPTLNMEAVYPIECGAPARVLLQHEQEPVGGQFLLFFLGISRIGRVISSSLYDRRRFHSRLSRLGSRLRF